MENNKCPKGRIFSIQHYCIHDGPGIRTTVFLKGCPLHCKWCANPESQKGAPQHLYRSNLCIGCGACISVCPQQAISLRNDKAFVDFSKCNDCGICCGICAKDAHTLMGQQMEVEEVFQQVKQDSLFYGNDGGVTMSGGEPLEQPEFVSSLFERCKNAGYTTAIETSGFAVWERLSCIAELTDVFLYDLKMMDPILHKEATGQDNELILENLIRLSKMHTGRIIVRIPVIVGYNDSIKNMEESGRFIRRFVPNCHEINLLPYHNLGEDKYVQMGITDRNVVFRTPEPEELEKCKSILANYVDIIK